MAHQRNYQSPPPERKLLQLSGCTLTSRQADGALGLTSAFGTETTLRSGLLSVNAFFMLENIHCSIPPVELATEGLVFGSSS